MKQEEFRKVLFLGKNDILVLRIIFKIIFVLLILLIMFKIFSTKCYLDLEKKNNINILLSKYNFESLSIYQNHLKYFIDFDIERDNDNINLMPSDGSIELELLGILDYCKIYKYGDLIQILEEICPDEISLNIKGFGNVDQNDFKKIVKIEDIDYSNIITQLEKIDIVETKPSKCILRTDERVFKIKNDDIYKDFYEVDCLGTAHKNELSEKIKDLYLTYIQ